MVMKRLKLIRLRRQLKQAINESRYRHGIWAKWHKTKDWRRRHHSYMDWKRAVQKIREIQKEITALEQSMQKNASVPTEAVAKAIGAWEGGQSSDGLFHPYWDEWGKVWTIGYGHTNADSSLHVDANTRPLTRAEAVTLLLHDLSASYGPNVKSYRDRYHYTAMKQKEFDALVSFAYNLGPGYFATGNLIGNALAAHDRPGVANAMLQYNHAGGQVLEGLTRRRRWERQLFLGGTYDVSN